MTLGAKGRACEGNPIKTPLNLLLMHTQLFVLALFTALICGKIQNRPVMLLLDTGSPTSMLNNTIWEEIKQADDVVQPWNGNVLIGVGGQHLEIQGTTQAVQIDDHFFPIMILIVRDLSTEAIIGLDFLEANQCILAVGERLFHIPSCKKPIAVTGNCDRPTAAKVVMGETKFIPPYSEVDVMATVLVTSLGKPCVVGSTPIKTAVMNARTHCRDNSSEIT